MDTQEDQIKNLKIRIRNLERSLSESEALSLEQIECTHRLEQQLFEARELLQQREQELEACIQARKERATPPMSEDYQLQAQHIDELQKIIWDLERRPTQDHYQVLQQQLATSQAEIDMLKVELQRRIEPDRFFQLQQELQDLKAYAEQLGDMAARFPQVQLQQTQVQLENHELVTEIAALKAQVAELEQRPSPQEVEDHIQQLETEHELVQTQLRQDLQATQDQLARLQDPEQRSETDDWMVELADRITTHDRNESIIADLNQQIEHLQIQASEVDTLKTELDQAQIIIQELQHRPTQDEITKWQQQVEALEFQLSASEEALALRPTPTQLAQLQAEVNQLQLELSNRDLANSDTPSLESLFDTAFETATGFEAAADFESSFESNQEELQQLQQAVESLQARLQEAEMALDQQPTVEALQQLEQQLAVAQSELETRPTLEDWHQLHQELAQRPTVIEAADWQAQIEHLQAQLQTTQQELAQQATGVEDQQHWDQQIQAVQAQLDRVTFELHQSQSQADEWQSQIKQLHHQLASAQQVLESQPSPDDLAELKQRPTLAQAEQWQEQISYLQLQLESVQAELIQLSEPSDTKHEIEHLQATLEQLQTEWDHQSQQYSMHKAELDNSNQTLRLELEQLQEQLQIQQEQRDQLAHQLQQRPTIAQFQEVKRRQELAEAHYVVSKKQVERLQQKIEELKTECVQAHAYAQTQEKEITLLENEKQDLTSQLAYFLNQPKQAVISPLVTAPDVQRGPLSSKVQLPLLKDIQMSEVTSSEPADPSPPPENTSIPIEAPPPSPVEQHPSKSPLPLTHPSFRPRSGIPPLSLEKTSPGSSDDKMLTLKSKSDTKLEPGTASDPQRPATPRSKTNRVELPTFVQQRR